MTVVTIAFLGDIFGTPGLLALRQQLPRLRADHQPDVVIANGENARRGSGLSPDLYTKIRECGVDAITLGDHAYRYAKIDSILQQADEPIARPANLPAKAVGRTVVRIPPQGERTKSVFVITLLGRVFFPIPADDPFVTADRLLEQLPESDPLVVVEAHMEATSEKAAIARYLDGRVAAIVGSHTHIPTADARVLPGGSGFITDVGMCGPYNSIIGREIRSTLRQMTTGMYVPAEVGSGDEAVCGVIIKVDEARRRCLEIERVEYRVDRTEPPFV